MLKKRLKYRLSICVVGLLRVVVYENHKYIARSAVRNLTNFNPPSVGRTNMHAVDYSFRKLSISRTKENSMRIIWFMGFSLDVTKMQTTKLMILLRFYFHDV